MRVTLPESGSKRSRSLGGTTVSTLVHAAVISAVVVTTSYGTEHVRVPGKPELVTLVAPPVRKPEVPSPAHRAPPRPAVPTNLRIAPERYIPLNIRIPDGLPPVDSRIGTVSLEEFAARPRDSVPTALRAAGREDQPYTDLTVERQVVARPGNLPPRYPDLLRSAGVEGAVHAQFVVDTTGRVERESIRFRRSDHQLFERAVIETLLRSRYMPAEVAGRKVRQLVEQAFSFTLGRSS
jgi:protein TonB